MGFAYEMVGRLFSRQQMKRLGELLDSSGLGFVPEAFAGFVVLLCLLSSIVLYVGLTNFAYTRSLVFRASFSLAPDLVVSSQALMVVAFAILSVLFAVAAILLASYVVLMLLSNGRTRRVDEVLPEFLSLSAANMRAGMTIDQAMWYAAKPEFGILSEEVSIVAKRTFGGVPFNQSIDLLSERFKSKSVRRAVSLIKQGIASGGKLADILERTAEEARQLQILRKEIASSLLMYIIFIVFAGAIGTPFLFAISGKLVAMIEQVFLSMPQASASAMASMGSTFSVQTKTVVSSEEFFLFTVLCTAMTVIFSSLIVGAI